MTALLAPAAPRVEPTSLLNLVAGEFAALTGGGETSKISRHGIESYVFNPTTEQRIVADFRDSRPGDKHFHWEQRGVPFRLEVGPRDVDAGAFVLKGRIDGSKQTVPLAEITGLHAVSLQPAAGSQGELTGLLLMRA